MRGFVGRRGGTEHTEGVRHNFAGEVVDDEDQPALVVGIRAFCRPGRQRTRGIAHLLHALHQARRRIILDIDQTLDARNALAAGGRLLIVANRFLPYERLLRATFGQVETLAADGRYQVLAARKRLRQRDTARRFSS